MKELIEALQIFYKYTQAKYPTHCEHDALFVDCDPKDVSPEDKARLVELGFLDGSGTDEYQNGFYSYRFGSC